MKVFISVSFAYAVLQVVSVLAQSSENLLELPTFVATIQANKRKKQCVNTKGVKFKKKVGNKRITYTCSNCCNTASKKRKNCKDKAKYAFRGQKKTI